MNWFAKSKLHLQQVQETYTQHGWFAIKWGFFLMATGIASILHGIFPFLFPFTAPKNILRLKKLLDDRKEEDRIRRAEGSAFQSE